jgi:hypothetical protein
LKSHEAQFGKKSVQAMVIVSWMATVYYLREEYIKADKACREALLAFDGLLGPDHENTLGIAYRLGRLCYDR